MPRKSPQRAERPTIRDVAAHAGVSTATVSRVLAGLGGASEAVERKIRMSVEKMGYRPNASARALRVNERKLIGLVLPNLRNPFFTSLAHGVEEHLGARGYTMLLGHSAEDANRERRHLEVFSSEGVAGFVFVPSNAPGCKYSKLPELGLPFVAVDRAPRGLVCDLVRSDNRGSARAACLHLLRLGYRNLALINGPANLDVSRARHAGVRDAFEELNLDPDALVLEEGDFLQSGGMQAMRLLLSRQRPPQAVIVGNNLMTLGALEVVHARGLRVPQDIALLCFDDMPWAKSLRPAMTAVAQPAEEMGRTAATLLFERLSHPELKPRTVTLANQLNVRASCGSVT